MSNSTITHMIHDTRTVHEIHISLPDSIAEPIDTYDEVYIIIEGREGASTRKRLNYGDLRSILGDAHRDTPVKQKL